MSLDPTSLFEFNKANLFEDPAFPSIPFCRTCQDMICRIYPADFKSGPFQEDAPTNLVVAPSITSMNIVPLEGKTLKTNRHFDVSSSVRLHWFGSHRVLTFKKQY